MIERNYRCSIIRANSQADKIHASIFEEVEGLDEVFERAPQMVKLPYHNGITCPHKREKFL
jgi:hypothetical protein